MNASEITARATRVAALAVFVATFDRESDRVDIVQRLLTAGIVRTETADLLLEEAGAA